jgi:hypothetical protein
VIDISKLNEIDKGRRVKYRGCGLTEWGTIRRWSDRYVWVFYTEKQYDGHQRQERTGALPEATDPKDLEFC